MVQYNDYELLYLISEFDEEAETILFNKYMNLIRSRIKGFKIVSRYKEDYMQEGLFMLVVAIRTYNQDFKKTFNKYFDLILQRRFIHLLMREKNYFNNVSYVDESQILSHPDVLVYEYNKNIKFSSFEEKVIYLKERNYRPKDIASILDCEIKSVYNCLCRIKEKYNS